MYKTEMNRLNKKIDEARITQKYKRALHDLVDEFFSVENYEKITEKGEQEIRRNFEIHCLTCKLCGVRSDSNEVQRIIDQIETSLFTILDRSVDKTRKTWYEKVLSSLHIEIHYHRRG